MTRVAVALPLSLSAFLTTLALAAAAIGGGLLSDDGIRLWAGAITASDGGASLGRIVASYPSIPFLVSTLLQFFTPFGTPAPSLLAAAMIGMLAGIWYLELRGSGLSFRLAIAASLLLALHPAMLRAGITGAADVFLATFLFLLAHALFNLRVRAAVPESMAVGFALVGLAFSHPIGIAFAASPFLIFALPPGVIASSAVNMTLVLVFPTAFCIGAFVYVSRVFPGSGWSFFAAPSESLATWTAGVNELLGPGATSLATLNTAMTVTMALLLGAPVVLLALALAWRRQPLVMPVLVVIAMTISAAMIAVSTGLLGNPAAVGVAAPILALLVLVRIPEVARWPTRLIALLVVGWIGGLLGTLTIDPGAALALAGADSRLRAAERNDALQLGAATRNLDDIMVDSEHAPMVVIGRERALGLIAPNSDAYALSMLRSRLDAPHVAVPDPHSPSGVQDELTKSFPSLFRNGAPGYRLVYQNRTWRLFARDIKDGSK